MTIALPNAPAPAPRRQMLVATAIASGAASMLMMGMLSLWLKFRAAAPTRQTEDGLYVIKDWLPADLKIPEVAANVMLATIALLAFVAQWAVYSAKREDSQHRSLALGVCLVMGVALVNAQLSVYTQMDLGIASGSYQTMFYAVTGTMLALIGSGMAFTAVALFRSVGGRADDTQLISSHALYWYFLTAAFTVMWFVVYVQK